MSDDGQEPVRIAMWSGPRNLSKLDAAYAARTATEGTPLG